MFCFEYLAMILRLLQCSLCAEQRKNQWLAMFCLYTLPLRPAQAKVQMLTAICSIVKLIPWNKVDLSHLKLNKIFWTFFYWPQSFLPVALLSSTALWSKDFIFAFSIFSRSQDLVSTVLSIPAVKYLVFEPVK